MGRDRGGGRSNRGGGTADGGRGVSVGRSGSSDRDSGDRRGDRASTNVSFGGGFDTRSQREQRRGNEPSPDAFSQEQISAVAEAVGVNEAVASMASIADPKGFKAAVDLAERRRGVMEGGFLSGIESVAKASVPGASFGLGIAEGMQESLQKRAFASVGVDVGKSISVKEAAQMGLSAAQEGAGISQAVGFGAKFSDIAASVVSAPSSFLGGFAGKAIGRIGGSLQETLSSDAGPSAAERAGMSTGDSDGTISSIAQTGGAPEETTEEATTAESVTAKTVQSRARTDLDLRRRTRPASFLGGPFQIQSVSLTG